jgi:hypothetical protein
MKSTDVPMKVLAFMALLGADLPWLDAIAGSAWAQEATGTSPELADANAVATRFPERGLAVLDCAPVAPAPADSCVLRVPPSRLLDRMEKVETGGVSGEFGVETDLSGVAPGLRLSKTMVLVDLTPGLGGERKPGWVRERALILDLVKSLPDDQPVALYGFNEGLERLTDFSTDKALLEQTVAGLELRGSNTRIATSARDAIILMGAQEDTVLRNLIIVSDGEEEGTRAVAEVAAAAVEHGVTVSTLGVFWRPVGAPQNGAGLDYLATLSEGSLGATGGINVGRAEEARAGLAEFVAGVNGAIQESGLIVPRGTPVEADITAILRKPRVGESGAFDEERVTARFTPVAMRGKVADPDQGPDPDAAPEVDSPAWHQTEWMGYPVLWWLIGAGVLALGSVGALGAVLRNGSRPTPSEDMLPLIDGQAPDVAPALGPVVTPTAPALAYLVRTDTGERLAVRRPRVTIGRSDTCDVVVADASVSRLHAELERRGPDSFSVTDSGSLNKTRVNGKVISETRILKAGDEVRFGEIKLRFTLA